MNQKLDNKLEPILKYTVKLFIEEGEPVSSQALMDRFNDISFSSAKVRYLMNKLEEIGYLQKANCSSGRTPTLLGLNYYAIYLSQSFEKEMINKLEKIFKQKEVDIDNTVDQAANIISEMTGLTLVKTNYNNNETLKSIDMTVLDEKRATIVMVVSTGQVYYKVITIDRNNNLNDIKIALKIFKERLIDVLVTELAQRVFLLKDILSESIKNYQSIIDSFVRQVFNGEIRKYKENKIYGKNNIILSQKINRNNLNKMIELIENYSIWEKIESHFDENEKIKISVDDTGSFMSKRIINNDTTTEISVVASSTSDYNKMRTALNALEIFVEKEKREK
ncbi:heat-inducible transcriptional repressor HrcA [Mycoplasma sp. CSL10137]|uniref:heat-inducible transcriptional repressor HrcA n=1 Tax=unclassified Mycoplasma TaxID=2683645 RepID=UPI00197C1E2A|nr:MULTISPECIES: heat-inducible transcriptional repressor HrcA [unclassified Mycoplasma]MBN4083559.1 heat-inducible transcriptional repressor HrcA [Mycoplasma sp. CSL10137]MBN4084510.1 heat-inducible transcriptional repressor HrcA [Mycoplasma sp. CSL10166]